MLKHCPKDTIMIKDLKKIIINILLESDTSKDIFNKDLLLRLQNYSVVQTKINSSQPEVLSEEMSM